jgi:hypothetical protein
MKSQFRRPIYVMILSLVLVLLFAAQADAGITKKEMYEAQKVWGDGVVAIGKAYTSDGDYRKLAAEQVDNLYAYQLGPVLFAPTKAAEKQFRLTRRGAISYFVGGDKKFPEDKGFALQPWRKVRFKNVGTYINGDYGVIMGNYYFTPKKGKPVKVEFTFGFIKGEDGKLRINLHHSSIPYSGEENV